MCPYRCAYLGGKTSPTLTNNMLPGAFQKQKFRKHGEKNKNNKN
jgi:hypothetical protein